MSEQLQDSLRVFVAPVEIFEVAEIDIYEKMVYLVIRSHCNARDNIAWPSYDTIAREGSMSRRKAIDAVRGLLEKGLLIKNEGSSKPHRSVTKNGRIRNDSNRYELERPSVLMAHGRLTSNKPNQNRTKKTSARHAPPLVHDMHHPSAQRAPEYNHLKESLLNMFDCMGAPAETAAAADSSEPVQNEIYEALNEYIPKYVYVDGIPVGESYIADIFCMLVRQFPDRLDPEIVEMAARMYFDRTAQYAPGTPNGISMKIDVKNPVGLYQTCYKEAIQLYKALNHARGKRP